MLLLQVATKRITDTVPQHIYFHLLKDFMQRMDSHLLTLLDSSGTDEQPKKSPEELMQEHPSIAKERHALLALSKQLKRAQDILSLL